MARRTTGTVATPDGSDMRYALALPEGSPPPGGWPGVIVLFEIFGLTPEIAAVGDRFADRGWAAYLPDFYSTGRMRCLFRAGRELIAGRPGPLTAALSTAGRDFAAREDVNADRLAVLGFCLGGGLALLLGSMPELGLRAVASNYGRTPATETLRTSPPVVASYGGRDASMRGESARLSERLAQCGVPADIRTYPEAGHSFLTEGHHPVASRIMFPIHAGYVPAAAGDAWRRIDAWLDTHTATEHSD